MNCKTCNDTKIRVYKKDETTVEEPCPECTKLHECRGYLPVKHIAISYYGLTGTRCPLCICLDQLFTLNSNLDSILRQLANMKPSIERILACIRE